MADWRKIETELARLLKSEGSPTCIADGELYIGVQRPRITERVERGVARKKVVVDSDEPTRIVSISDLARTLSTIL